MIPATSTNISETAVYIDAVVYSPDLVMHVDISNTGVHGSDVTVKSAAVETSGMEPAVEPTAVEPAMPTASVPSASACEGKIRLAEDSRAQ
jgi:hypothetical protein